MFLQYGVIIAVLFWLLKWISSGLLFLGSYVAIAQAMWNFVGDFQYELIQMFRELKAERLLTKEFAVFLSSGGREAEDCGDEAQPETQFARLELKDIWFRYTQDAPYILRGVNLTINHGKKIGLIGENGSGKITLIKIMLGLLVPEKVMILLNDQELKMVLYVIV